MDKIVIQGGLPLQGKIKISGSKNAALPILAATLLCSAPVEIRNVPDLRDIRTMASLLESFGLKIRLGNQRIKVEPRPFTNHIASYELVKTMRASILVLGPLLSKFGKAKVSLPGGCAIGARPVDRHLKALEEMGAEIKIEHGYIDAVCPRLKGCRIVFNDVTVTGTENILMAAVLAEGTTVIENAALEPEVVDLAQFLKAMGARVSGEGTSVIQVEGVKALGPLRRPYLVMADRIEAGTFMMAAAMTGGHILVEQIDSAHLTALIQKLQESGVMVERVSSGIEIKGPAKLNSVDVVTSPYPGFATDFQAQFMAMMTTASGTSTVIESIFENRFMHVGELVRMGAQIQADGNRAVIKGVNQLSAAPIMATDLRASACLVLAGLVAEGITEISRVYHIDRGYEKIEKKFRALGAKVKRVKLKY